MNGLVPTHADQARRRLAAAAVVALAAASPPTRRASPKAPRGAGAPNLLVLGGVHKAEMLDRWLEFAPQDPLRNVAAGFHNYPYNKYCASTDCYDTGVSSSRRGWPAAEQPLRAAPS